MERYGKKLLTIFIAALFIIQVTSTPTFTRSNLIINEVTPATFDNCEAIFRSARYKRLADYNHGIATGSATIIGDSHVVEPGQYYELTCKTHFESPASNVYWIRGDDVENEIENLKNRNRENYSVSTDKGAWIVKESKYIINCASKAAEGRYTCVSISQDNKVYKDSTDVHVKRNANNKCTKHHSPTIIQHMKTIISVIGSDVTFYCKATKDATITWVRLDDYDKYSRLKDDRYSIVGDNLIIQSIKWSDMGVYVCIAKTENGEDHAETFLYPSKSPEDDE